MKDTYDLWLESFKEFPETEFWLLEESKDGSVKLFSTKTKYLCNNNYYYDTPVYHVWCDRKHVLSTTGYLAAYKKWERLVNGN